MPSKRIRLGCEGLLDRSPPWFRTARLGLLANQASVTSSFEPVNLAVCKAGGRLSCLFSPQHGFHAEKQANMVESADGWDSSLSIPVFSLYGSVREPAPEMLEHLDVLLIDLQDVGTRVYTYGVTMGLCMEAAGRAGIKVAVLDRPNPINGAQIEGNILKEDFSSFVGRYPIPMRHGLTLGELALYVARQCGVECDLEVIPVKGWNRSDFFPKSDLPWVFPSPNMPTWETALLYPGMVLLEGTNLSEGRGTTLPFHLFGAPFVDQPRLAGSLRSSALEGAVLRPVCFEPVFDKWQGQICRGFQIHITDPHGFRPYRFALSLLESLLQVHGDQFRWLPPPYEYEREKLPMDILLGDGGLRQQIEKGVEMEEIEAGWEQDLALYSEKRERCLLYEDGEAVNKRSVNR